MSKFSFLPIRAAVKTAGPVNPAQPKSGNRQTRAYRHARIRLGPPPGAFIMQARTFVWPAGKSRRPCARAHTHSGRIGRVCSRGRLSNFPVRSVCRALKPGGAGRVRAPSPKTRRAVELFMRISFRGRVVFLPRRRGGPSFPPLVKTSSGRPAPSPRLARRILSSRNNYSRISSLTRFLE